MPRTLLLSAATALLGSGWLPASSAFSPMRRDRGPLFTTSTVVHTLNSSNFDAILDDSQTVWLVDFYSPWCPHCRQFAPQWEEVASVYGSVESIQFGAVDCTKQNEICDREDVHAYPGVKLYHVSEEAITMPHVGNVYARHVAKWLEETLKEHGMGPLIDVDKVYPKNPLRNDLKKKEFKFGDPVEPLQDDRSVDMQMKRLKDAGVTALFILEDGFFMGTTMLAGERYEAAVTWVKTLAGAFPRKENRAAFAVLVDMMKDKEQWQQADWTDMLEKWKSSVNERSYPVNLFSSKDDLVLCTTYTCGLWTVFHSLTVSGVEQLKPSEIMSAIRLVVKHFFGCEECKRHFLKANPESVITKLALRDEDGPHAVALWIWTMHNTVNKVLGKPRWPTNLSCPNCYTTTDEPQSLDPTQLNDEDIVAYIRRVYKIETNVNVSSQAAGSSSWYSMGVLAVVALLFVIYRTLFQQHKHRLVGMKSLKMRDHIA